jgi:hypothetical protein
MSRKGGGFGMRAETLALAYDGGLRFKRMHCDTCKEERIFRGIKCTHCNELKKLTTPRGNIAKYNPRDFRGANGRIAARNTMLSQAKKQALEARKAAFAAQAEESRKKFEGSK